ncbi:hypothetical protein DPSP01_007315 [Paraphaeosphaeria sporulosa]
MRDSEQPLHQRGHSPPTPRSTGLTRGETPCRTLQTLPASICHPAPGRIAREHVDGWQRLCSAIHGRQRVQATVVPSASSQHRHLPDNSTVGVGQRVAGPAPPPPPAPTPETSWIRCISLVRRGHLPSTVMNDWHHLGLVGHRAAIALLRAPSTDHCHRANHLRPPPTVHAHHDPCSDASDARRTMRQNRLPHVSRRLDRQ